MLTITIGEDSFTLTDTQHKALRIREGDVFSSLQTMIMNKVNLSINVVCAENSKYNVNKLTQEEKNTIIDNLSEE